MDAVKILTKDIAEDFIRDQESVDLWEFTTIEDEAAKILSGYKPEHDWENVGLSGLKALSDESAKQLSLISNLDLDGLEELTDSQAAILGNNPGMLRLDSIKIISRQQAEDLLKKRTRISLQGLETLSVEVLQALSKAEFLILKFDSLSNEQAAIIFASTGELSLNLSSLSDSVANCLKDKTCTLNLWGLRTLSATAAAALAEHKGDLTLGVSTLSDAATEALAKRKGDLDLEALQYLSPKAIESLHQYDGELTWCPDLLQATKKFHIKYTRVVNEYTVYEAYAEDRAGAINLVSDYEEDEINCFVISEDSDVQTTAVDAVWEPDEAKK